MKFNILIYINYLKILLIKNIRDIIKMIFMISKGDIWKKKYDIYSFI